MPHRWLVLTLFMALIGCKGSIEHDEMSAATSAVKFTQAAFVKRDFEKGYGLLSDSGRRYVPLETFKQTVSKLHPRTFPLSVTASEAEPMQGEKAIHIYLTGENTGERFYYRLTMEGDAATGYTVARFYRESEPYPWSSLRHKLKEPLTTGS